MPELTIRKGPEVIAAAVAAKYAAIRHNAARAVFFREAYERCIDIDSVPDLYELLMAARSAVEYARQALPAADLPKRFRWHGTEYALIFTDQGSVYVADRAGHENLCTGLQQWADEIRPAET